MELIDKAKLYNAIAELEDKATDNFLKESQDSQHKLLCMGELRGITTIKHLVADFPTVEPPKGEWKVKHGAFFDYYECNKCHACHQFRSYFCHHCGADMRGNK